ncbi:hypothetical protein JCM14469_28290 [Desulfatiferula olefinivorans]
MMQAGRVLFLVWMMGLIAVWGAGCRPGGGPSLPQSAIDEGLPENVKGPLNALYDRDADAVLSAMETLADLGADALPSIPYLVSMLDDPRLGTRWVRGYGAPLPLSKGAALALGAMGPPGVHALADALAGTSQVRGMQDDLKREAVAGGFKRALALYGDDVAAGVRHSPRAVSILSAARVCLALSEAPDRLDPVDPRAGLKYYKYFDPIPGREGLAVYIEMLGLIGDDRALDLLRTIAPPDGSGSVEGFETPALIAWYRIEPLPVSAMHPALAERLLIEFTVRGDLPRVSGLLEQGLSPDVVSRTGRPLIALALDNRHTDLFEALVRAGALVDIRLSGDDTLLIRSARAGKPDDVHALLFQGADPGLVNRAGETALSAALDGLRGAWNGSADDPDAREYLQTVARLASEGVFDLPDDLVRRFEDREWALLGLGDR